MPEKVPDHLKKRLPPGQTYSEKWPVLHEGSPLEFDPKKWRLKVHGPVENPRNVSWEEFLAWPRTETMSDFHCVTRWSNFDNRWRGTPFTEFAKIIRPNPDAKFVRFADHQGYDTSLPREACARVGVLLATHWNGKPLEPDHGGPMRLIVPKLYGWKSCKWVVEIEFLPKDKLGYWEIRGYHNDADSWKEERFS
ncbi:MAG TPA: molybdopterin-dependent oxidoreductase [Bdellovibrionota bacterium]|nr:molybdopterin-dependent oxidoreductase [Bdellovibrionota bacterium]